MRRRHPNVDDDELGLVLAHEREELVRVPGLTDNLEVAPFEQTREAFAQQDVVVGDDDPTAAFRRRVDRPPTLRGSDSGYIDTHVIGVRRGALVGYRRGLF